MPESLLRVCIQHTISKLSPAEDFNAYLGGFEAEFMDKPHHQNSQVLAIPSTSEVVRLSEVGWGS